jgi:hypothetical protein
VKWSGAGAPASSRVTVCDAAGRIVRETALRREQREYTWDGRNFRDRDVPSGIYFLRFSAEGRDRVRKVLMIR